MFIFWLLRYFKKFNIYKFVRFNKLLFYICIREFILNVLKEVGEDFLKFGVYFLRFGGVMVVVNLDILDRLFKVYGRWRSEMVKDGYI